ncbi:MAG: class I SAM-dependent methyltransferase [Candidatus Thorarchaeota archaeon]
MKRKRLTKFYSQLDLPFQETAQFYLKDIFRTLESKFNLCKNSKQTFIDLGSGNGQVVIFCAFNYGIESTGVEIDPILIKETKNSVRSLKKSKTVKKGVLNKIRFISGDFCEIELKHYNFIYIYSLPSMQKYLKHVFKMVKSGAIIISHMYPLKNFSECLNFKLKLNHEVKNHDATTYFYRKI